MGIVLGFFVCVFYLISSFTTEVNAAEYDWTKGVPTLHYQKETSFEWTPHCPTYYQKEDIKNVDDLTRVCQFEGEPLRIGLSYPDNGRIRLVIADAFEAVMYEVEGVCMGIRSCVYTPQSDTLIALYYTQYGYLSVEVFRNVAERIRVAFDPGSGKTKYTFDTSNPDFRFTSEEGKPLPVEAVAASNNGEWLGVEYRNYGIILINQETFEMRRVLAPGFRYGLSVDPTVEMAISNDGRAVAVMGERSGVMVAGITPECGDRVRSDMRELFQGEVIRCPLANVDPGSFIPQFHGAYDPHFDDSGGRLDFTVLSKTGEAKRVGVRAVGSSPTPLLEYLAIGDSFTSGEGETEYRNYLARTDDEFEKCHVSNRSYPFLFAALIGLSSVRNVACSGAKTTDIFTGTGYLGQGGRLGVGGLRLSESGIHDEQARALDSFHPGVTAQSEFVERYEPGLLTVGIGGNDAGLTTKLRACAVPGECEWTSEVGRQKTAEEIQSLFGRFVAFYRKLADLSPSSRIIAIGYPLAVDVDGVCDPVTATLFSKDELRFMNESISYLNQVIERAVRFVGLTFADMSQVFDRHQLCSGSLTPAMSGLRGGDDAGIGTFLPFRIIGNESFHPTPYGHELVAHELRRRFDQLMNVTGCSDCADIPPDWPEYWGSEGSVTSRLRDFVTPTVLTPLNSTISIALPEKSLLAGTAARVEIHSDPTVLGTLTVNEQGGLNGTLSISSELDEGYHTIHLFGTSYSGEDIELYQGIMYEKPLVPGLASEGEPDDHEERTVLLETVGPYQASVVSDKLASGSVLGATTSSGTIGIRREVAGWPIIGAITLLVIGVVVYIVVRKQRRNPP